MPILVNVTKHFTNHRRVYMTAFHRVNQRARNEDGRRQPSGRSLLKSLWLRGRGGRRPGHLRIKTYQLGKRTLARPICNGNSWSLGGRWLAGCAPGTIRLLDKTTSLGAVDLSTVSDGFTCPSGR